MQSHACRQGKVCQGGLGVVFHLGILHHHDETLPNVEEAVQVVEPATAEVMEGPLCPLTQ